MVVVDYPLTKAYEGLRWWVVSGIDPAQHGCIEEQTPLSFRAVRSPTSHRVVDGAYWEAQELVVGINATLVYSSRPEGDVTAAHFMSGLTRKAGLSIHAASVSKVIFSYSPNRCLFIWGVCGEGK